MKLIFCDRCWDVFKLSTKDIRSCECGYCKGKYLPDGGRAVTNGHGIAMAFSNPSILKAIMGLYKKDTTVEFKAWIRPHSGQHNSRTTIQGDL